MKHALSSYPQGNCQDNRDNFLLYLKSEIRVEKIDVLLQRDTGRLASSLTGAAVPVLPARYQGVSVTESLGGNRKLLGVFSFFALQVSLSP